MDDSSVVSTGEQLRVQIEALAPERTQDPASVIALSDACFALEAKFSQALGLEVPKDLPERDQLRARCLELIHAWIPRLDAKNLQALEWRVKDRSTPIDLKGRKAQLEHEPGTKLPDRSKELAPYWDQPPLAGYEAIGVMFVEGRLLVGEWPEHSVKVDARPGVWLAYARELHEDDPSEELIVVHGDLLARVSDLRDGMTRIEGDLPIHGARMAVADARAAEDEDFIEALFEGEEEVYRGRGVQRGLGGDGHGIAWAHYADKLAVCVRIDLY